MLNQLGLKPIIDVAIMQSLCDMHELFQRGYPWRWLNQLTLKISALVIDTAILLVLNDHIVHDHKPCHAK
jgi:hypothetical protein